MDEDREYRAYLRRHFWRRIVPGCVGSGFVTGFCLADIHAFSVGGTYLLPPLIAAILVLASAGLALVALAAAWMIISHTSIWGEP